jgi:hypothetical protein
MDLPLPNQFALCARPTFRYYDGQDFCRVMLDLINE